MISRATDCCAVLSCVALTALVVWPSPGRSVALFALTDAEAVVQFDSATPDKLRTVPALLGFGTGENLIGIDLRPSDQRLYALTINTTHAGHLYTINTSTGAATLVGLLTPAVGSSYTTLSGTKFGMNFNPVPDRLRLVSDDGTDLRVVADTAQVIVDVALNPGSPHVVGVAYTNSYAGATSTTLYDIDSNTDSLLVQNPPNNGTLTPVGALGVDASDELGFDIAAQAAGNIAYAGLTVGGSTGLYMIDLVSGAATLHGNIGDGGVPVLSLVADVDYIFRDGFQ